MTGLHDKLIHGLDAAAERSGLAAVATRPLRRRHLRWTPVAALALAAGGMAFALARPDRFALALSFVVFGNSIAAMLTALGPLKPWGSAERVRRIRSFELAATPIS